jgi:hypothetical protein
VLKCSITSQFTLNEEKKAVWGMFFDPNLFILKKIAFKG